MTAEFEWIYISLFFTAVFLLTADGKQPVYLTVREGEKVTLSCDESVIKDQHKCQYTTWLRNHSGNTTELVQRGQIGEDGVISEKLSVTEDCSLLIKKASPEDVGRYDCQRFKFEGKSSDAQIYLSLLSMRELRTTEGSVTFRCSVSTPGKCLHKLSWLFEGRRLHHYGLNTFSIHCYTFVTIETDHPMYNSSYDSLQCKVTQDDAEQLFPFRLQPSGNEIPKMTTEPGTTAEQTTTDSTKINGEIIKAGRWRLIIVSVGLSALILTVVTVNIWIKIKVFQGKKQQKNDKMIEDSQIYSEVDVKRTKKTSSPPGLDIVVER
ncbi:uncharacterized protein LOC117823884 [Xyrichtys novacula]|uniref:Uncharacterized protein LOC117823884 n=1 Tax=Xyrichtys novacula TaxID=13765 RepID=A0AAV1GVS4_XYRNO|nr:uncharacterized protein LOC117823884 [Xyrichtys novacula]